MCTAISFDGEVCYCCVRGSRLFSNPVTYHCYIPSVTIAICLTATNYAYCTCSCYPYAHMQCQFNFCKKQVINKSASVILGLLGLLY